MSLSPSALILTLSTVRGSVVPREGLTSCPYAVHGSPADVLLTQSASPPNVVTSLTTSILSPFVQLQMESQGGGAS